MRETAEPEQSGRAPAERAAGAQEAQNWSRWAPRGQRRP